MYKLSHFQKKLKELTVSAPDEGLSTSVNSPRRVHQCFDHSLVSLCSESSHNHSGPSHVPCFHVFAASSESRTPNLFAAAAHHSVRHFFLSTLLNNGLASISCHKCFVRHLFMSFEPFVPCHHTVPASPRISTSAPAEPLSGVRRFLWQKSRLGRICSAFIWRGSRLRIYYFVCKIQLPSRSFACARSFSTHVVILARHSLFFWMTCGMNTVMQRSARST